MKSQLVHTKDLGVINLDSVAFAYSHGANALRVVYVLDTGVWPAKIDLEPVGLDIDKVLSDLSEAATRASVANLLIGAQLWCNLRYVAHIVCHQSHPERGPHIEVILNVGNEDGEGPKRLHCAYPNVEMCEAVYAKIAAGVKQPRGLYGASN